MLHQNKHGFLLTPTGGRTTFFALRAFVATCANFTAKKRVQTFGKRLHTGFSYPHGLWERLFLFLPRHDLEEAAATQHVGVTMSNCVIATAPYLITCLCCVNFVKKYEGVFCLRAKLAKLLLFCRERHENYKKSRGETNPLIQHTSPSFMFLRTTTTTSEPRFSPDVKRKQVRA